MTSVLANLHVAKGRMAAGPPPHWEKNEISWKSSI